MCCSCPLPNGKVPGVWYRSYQPFRNTQGRFCMAGYHCLMPTAFHPVQHNPHLTSCGFSIHCKTKHTQCPSAFLPLRHNKIKHLSAFLPLRLNPHLTSCGFSIHCKTKHTQCPSAFLPLRHNKTLTANGNHAILSKI